MTTGDWEAWHAAYDEPGSSMSRRLALVQRRLADAIRASPPGPISLISLCAGQGRDVLGVLASHPRRDDVRAVLVESNHGNVEHARAGAFEHGLSALEVVEGDAALGRNYRTIVPARLVLACGFFGHISGPDIEHTIKHLGSLCDTDATVIWTRHRRAPDLTGAVRRLFEDNGFSEVAFDFEEGFSFAVGTNRLIVDPQPFDAGLRLFDSFGASPKVGWRSRLRDRLGAAVPTRSRDLMHRS